MKVNMKSRCGFAAYASGLFQICIQVAYGKAPLRARGGRNWRKERAPSLEMLSVSCRCSAEKGVEKLGWRSGRCANVGGVCGFPHAYIPCSGSLEVHLDILHLAQQSLQYPVLAFLRHRPRSSSSSLSRPLPKFPSSFRRIRGRGVG